VETLLVGIAILLVGGALALLAGSRSRVSNAIGALSAVAGCAAALVPVLDVLRTGEAISYGPVAWNVPYGSFVVEVSPLSAWFALPILGLSLLAAVYGAGYTAHYADKKLLGPPWFFYNLLVVGMVLVVVARNGVLFLVSWEVMSLASYFLVTFEHEKQSVREAGRVYLIATHLGTACLLALFVLLGSKAGSLDFAAIRQAGAITGPLANGLFLLAIIGFGTKAGFMPLHVWLPEAHPAAPSHVSSVMSGVMIKTGIYGLVMTLGFLGSPPTWWGWLLIGIGVSSGVLGVLFALAQHDLKRLLAYHSVENIGIIALGLGVGLLGMSLNHPEMVVLGFGGGLLHVLNHAVFKGLLFLGAGAVIHGTHTAEIDELGGLQRKMPLTAITFLVGAVAISGLPPLNGFISEFLIYLGSYEEEIFLTAAGSVPALAVIGSLALIGGLALACFTKAFGVVFLGEPRRDHARNARPPGLLMQAPMVVLAALCLGIGLAAPWVVGQMEAVLVGVTGEAPDAIGEHLASATSPLISVVIATATVLGLCIVLVVVRKLLLSGREIGESGTWDCGYAQPTERMQYTSSSYAQPITWFFASVLRTRKTLKAPEGLFPADASLHTETPDVSMEHGYRPAFSLINWLFSKLQWIQHGRVNFYVMYIALTIVVLLVWFLGARA